MLPGRSLLSEIGSLLPEDDGYRRDALEVLLESILASNLLMPIGEQILRREIVRISKSEFPGRLSVGEMSGEIQAAVVTGLPRSGTTYLQHLLAGAFPNARHLIAWEAAGLTPQMSSEERQRWAKAREMVLNQRSPDFATIHPMRWNGLEECSALFELSLRSIFFTVLYPGGAYGDWLAKCDMRGAYDHWRSALHVLDNKATRWVLKSPQHSFALEEVWRVLPGAVAIVCRRSSDEVASSYASMVHAARSVTSAEVDPIALGTETSAWLRDVERKLSASVEQEGPCGRTLVIDYRQLIENPRQVVHQIADRMGWKQPPERLLREVVTQSGQAPCHKYNAETYGLG